MAKKRKAGKAQKAKRRRKQENARLLGHGPRPKQIRQPNFEPGALEALALLAPLLAKKKPKETQGDQLPSVRR